MVMISRRLAAQSLLAAGSAWAWQPRISRAADSPIELEWGDLVPESMAMEQTLAGIVQHDTWATTAAPAEDRFSMSNDDAADLIFESVVNDFDGKRVRLPGYAIPISLEGAETTEFLLAPYIGACIHVPPPPPNQIVFVTLGSAYEFTGLFDPVWVTGVMQTTALRSELADIGYQIEADGVEEYTF